MADQRENLPEDAEFPQVLLRLGTARRDNIKGTFLNTLRFKIDIFSEYDGESELYDMEENIYNAMSELYQFEHVIRVQESSFRILDDKSTGVKMKHGILNYLVMICGTEEEVEGE